MVEKLLFQEEVESLLGNGKETKEIKDKLDRAYTLASTVYEQKKKVDRQEAHSLVTEILEYLFKDKFSNSYSIPIEFIDSAIGNILFSLKFGLAEAVYTTAEITLIMGNTRALISHDLKHNLIRAARKGRNIIVYERDLIQYMVSKGMNKNDARRKLSLYSKLRAQGVADEEIRKELEVLK